MKKKTLLALGAVSLLGVATTVVLPLTLTSCSDEKTNQTTQPNSNIQVSITQSDDSKQSYITLTADVSFKNSDSGMNKSNFGYQWYYKEKSATSFLEFNPDPDAIKGFTSITNAISSTLKINTTEYPTTNLEKYEFICAAYETANPANYGLSSPITISTNSTKYIDINFGDFTGKTFKINDPGLKTLFENNKGKKVNIYSGNYLYQEIAKCIDPNYQTTGSLNNGMICTEIGKTKSNKWSVQVVVFSNVGKGYWFKNKKDNKVTNSISFTEFVDFESSSTK